MNKSKNLMKNLYFSFSLLTLTSFSLLSTGCGKTKILTEVNDPDLLSFFEHIPLKNYGVDLSQKLTLDQVWDSYKSFTPNEYADNYFLETNLKGENYYSCYYLQKSTIRKIDDLVKQEVTKTETFDNKETNYLRQYKKYLSQGKLSNNDKVYLYKMDINSSETSLEINRCQLVSITRNILLSNEKIGKYFVETINYSVDGKVALKEEDSLNIDSNNKPFLFFDLEKFCKFYKSPIYDSGFLPLYSYGIFDNSFDAIMKYDHSILDENPTYYDEIKTIFKTETFITTRDYIDNGVKHTYDYNNVVCDYLKAKVFFKIGVNRS